MQDQKNIIDCYNKTAEKYAEKFNNELEWKHFDQLILKSFCTENINKGRLIDLGCGPGQTTKYIYDQGLSNIIGTDISTKMLDIASRQYPKIKFEEADILQLQYKDNSYGSAIAFYVIVHFNYEQIEQALKEIKRILRNEGEFLFSFHIGDTTIHLDKFLDEDVYIDFYSFETEKILKIIDKIGFEVIDIIERYPYLEKEYPSKRAYIWIKKPE